MRKANYKEKAAAFNQVRQQYQGKCLECNEIYRLLKEAGISRLITCQLINDGVIRHERIGKKRLYSFQSTPLHYLKMETIFDKVAKKRYVPQKPIEPEAPLTPLEEVKNSGYKVFREEFDLDRFMQEEPILYKKYLKLVEV